MKFNWIKTKKQELNEKEKISAKKIKIHKINKRKPYSEILKDELINFMEAENNQVLCTDERHNNLRCPFCDAKMNVYYGRGSYSSEPVLFYECSNHCDENAHYQELVYDRTIWMFNKIIAEQRQKEISKDIEKMIKGSYGEKKAQAMYDKFDTQLSKELEEIGEASDETMKMMDKYEEIRRMYGL